MGYNSWYDLECSGSMNESTVRRSVDAFVALGFPKLGYVYFNLDDCIVDNNRTADGKLQSDRKTFPSGMRSLSDYVCVVVRVPC